jgi:hypothetical protein
VRRAENSGGAYTAIASGLTEASYADTGLAVGSTYHYVITPAHALGDGANSNEATGTSLSEIEGWRLTHFGTTAGDGDAVDSADPDGDGWTNAQEFISGTDPNDAASVLRVTRLHTSESDIALHFPTVAGRSYRLERSGTLLEGSWTMVEDNITGTGAEIQVTDPDGATDVKRFYRIVVIP